MSLAQSYKLETQIVERFNTEKLVSVSKTAVVLYIKKTFFSGVLSHKETGKNIS